MVWLVSHIWISLGLAALCGLAFGWAFRGLQLKARARDAFVQRDIALTELEQARLEIDQLYAAQSKGIGAAADAGDESLRVELEAREEKLQALGKELSASRDELASLKAKAVAAAGAGAVVAGVAGALASGSDENAGDKARPTERLDEGLNLNDAALAWRNRYLASRVRALEAAEQSAEAGDQEADEAALLATGASAARLATEIEDHSEGEAQLETGITAAEKQAWQNTYLRHRLAFMEEASALPAVAVPPSMDTQDPVEVSEAPEALEPSSEDEKAAWKADYLVQRIAYLENHPPRARPEIVSADAIDLPEAETDAVAEGVATDEDEVELQPVAEAADPGQLEQELARLRWRNRYLEGRLAYIDGDAPKAEAGDTDTPAPNMAAALAVEPVIDAPEPEPEPEIAPETAAPMDTEPEQAIEKPVVNEPAVKVEKPTAADAVLAAMEASTLSPDPVEAGKPPAMSAPDDGGDDLTRIQGVDDRVASTLNTLGIWHYHQIAGWSLENATWIDTHFQSEGRVASEDWVAQAGSLSLGADVT